MKIKVLGILLLLCGFAGAQHTFCSADQPCTTTNSNHHTGPETFTGLETHSGAATHTGVETFSVMHAKTPKYDLKAQTSAVCDGVADDTTGITAALIDVTLTATPRTLLFPEGTCIAHGISWTGVSVRLEGHGQGRSILQHKDGFAEPLVTVHGFDTGINAAPWGGIDGMTLKGGSQTTALWSFDGNVDNGIICHDIQFYGKNSPITMDAISIKDYLNFSCDKVRFDGVGNYAVKVRGPITFGLSYFNMSNFTWDNQNGTAGAIQWGAGLFSMDTTNILGSRKGNVSFAHGRIEVNEGLVGSVPTRSLIRIVQDPTSVTNQSAPLVTVVASDIELDASNASVSTTDWMNFKFLSTNASRIGFEPRNFSAWKVSELVNNDAGTMDQGFRTNNPSQNYWHVSGVGSGGSYITAASGQFNLLGLNMVTTDSDSNMGNLYGKEGDVIQYKRPRNVSGRVGRPFAYKIVGMVGAVTPPPGFCRVTPAAATTGTIASGSNILTITGTLSADFNPSMSLTVTGAGAAGADLVAMITSMNYSTKVITLDTNASTDKSGGTNVAVTQCLTRAVDMIEYGTVAAAAGRHEIGDVVKNTAPSANGTYGWVTTAAGTPGTSGATIPLADSAGKLDATTQLKNNTPTTLACAPTVAGGTVTGSGAAQNMMTCVIPSIPDGKCIRGSVHINGTFTSGPSKIFAWVFGPTSGFPTGSANSTYATTTAAASNVSASIVICNNAGAHTGNKMSAYPLVIGATLLGSGFTGSSIDTSVSTTLAFTMNAPGTESGEVKTGIVEILQ